ncbi:hypothetical protein KJ673_01135 [Patescibacteria group bacterium]|nr:hypothetical protein [Patescibacteria group bacterium]
MNSRIQPMILNPPKPWDGEERRGAPRYTVSQVRDGCRVDSFGRIWCKQITCCVCTDCGSCDADVGVKLTPSE